MLSKAAIQTLTDRVTQAATAIRDNPGLLTYTYMHVDEELNDCVCEICGHEGADRYVLFTARRLCMYHLCGSCCIPYATIQDNIVTRSIRRYRMRLLAPQFTIYYGGYSRCLICCYHESEMYKNDTVLFICKDCKGMGTETLCCEVLFTLSRLLIPDIVTKIVMLIYDISMDYDNV